MSDSSILIAGGGIAGLALARAFRQRGVPATIAERDRERSAGGLAINLPGNAVAALDRLGLREGLERLGRPVGRREYRTATGRLQFQVDENAFWGPDMRPRCVHRSDLVTLLTGTPDAPGRAAEVTTVRPASQGATVGFADGSTGEYGFVVGADGVRSAVRAQVLGATGVRSSLLSAASWRFMAPNPGVDCYTVFSGAAGAFLLLPVSDDEVYVYASATGGGPVEAEPSWLRQSFRGFPRPVRTVLDSVAAAPSALYHSPVEEVRLPSWHRGRSVVIGDAAHASAPVWAQGAALALEDALVLADVLADGGWDTAGARYEARRRPRVEHVQKMTDRTSRSTRLPGWLRGLALPQAYRATYGPLRRPVELRPVPVR